MSKAAVVLGMVMTLLPAIHAAETRSAAPSGPATQSAQVAELRRQIDELRKKAEAAHALCDSMSLRARDVSAGRYQIVMRDGVRADTFLLDTETGRVWKPVTITNVKGEPEIWRIADRVDTAADFDAWQTRMIDEGMLKEAGP